MTYGWCFDPCKVIEASERQICCPSCTHNKHSMENNRKRFYCNLGHDQNEGLRGQRDCNYFFHKGLARHASAHDKGK